MCFSASASFGAGVVLTIIGIATIKKTHHPTQLLFASIPLLFGFQQISEGVLWLTISNPEYQTVTNITTYFFIFLAQVLWPMWVPISILIFSQKENRKLIQKMAVGSGVVVSIFLAYCLLSFDVSVEMLENHIKYYQDYPVDLKKYGVVLYVFATIAPPFFSKEKKMWMLGLGILFSYVVTLFFYQNHILSVWCFFASIISVIVYFIVREKTVLVKKNQPTL